MVAKKRVQEQEKIIKKSKLDNKNNLQRKTEESHYKNKTRIVRANKNNDNKNVYRKREENNKKKQMNRTIRTTCTGKEKEN